MMKSSHGAADKYAELTALFCAGVQGDSARYNQFLQTLSLILRRILGKRIPVCDVEDVLQEILISIHKARHTYDGHRPLMPWILAIASFRINDHLRRLYARSCENVDSDLITEIMDSTVTESHDETELVNGLLHDIPEQQRRILTLMYVEGYTAKETGRQLNMNESAVKVAAHRTIKRIRERLAK